MTLDEEIQAIRDLVQDHLKDLQARADALLRTKKDALQQAVQRYGFIWCDNCDGTGAVERLDSGYMRKFGLREWDGCQRCGGSLDQRGKGYY